LYKRLLTTILLIVICFCSLSFISCKKDNSFTVTFTNGYDESAPYYGDAVQVVTSAKQIVEPIFVRDGYNFVGWNVSISRIKSSTTVVAQWKKYQMHVVFNGNGGKDDFGNSTISMTVDSAKELVDNQPQFKKKGYALSWEPQLETITKSCTVNAVWTIKDYNLTFKNKFGQDFANNKLSITYKHKLDYAQVQAPQITGEKFAYWIDEQGLPIDRNIVWDVDCDTVFTAVYVSNQDYVINYDLDGGDRQTIAVQRYFNQNTQINLTNPTRKGYNFDGWQINGGSEKYSSEQITLEQIKVDGELCDVNLKATWSNVPYTASLDADGGQFTGQQQIEFFYDLEIGALPSPQKANYQFVGWFYGEEQIKEGDTWQYVQDITITAKYKAIYKVKFSLSSYVIITGEQVSCELVKWGEVPKAQSLEDVEIEIVEGQSLLSLDIAIMPVVKPIEEINVKEYLFGNYWKYLDSQNNSYKILVSTIFNGENLPGISAGDTIVLVPHVKLTWAPNY